MSATTYYDRMMTNMFGDMSDEEIRDAMWFSILAGLWRDGERYGEEMQRRAQWRQVMNVPETVEPSGGVRHG